MKVVICDYEFDNVDPEKEALSIVKPLELVPAQCRTEEQVMELTRNADGVINQWNHITAKVIENMRQCKVIATYGIGTDKIDVEAATKKGIYVCNVPDYCVNEVSNHAMGMIMALSRQFVQLDKLIRQGKYGFMHLDNQIHSLESSSVGLVGFGKIPKNLARKLQCSFGMKIYIFDPFVTEEQAKEQGVIKCSLDELLGQSDYVSIHVPLTKATYHLINEDKLRLMKKTAYLVNAGRGAIVDEQALYKLLKEKAIAGAAVDVFETEPIKPDDPLLTLDNVFVTPHSAWHSRESMVALQSGAAKEVARVLTGQTPKSAVNYKDIHNLN
ncbi:MAG: C-terminal binding protein [Christensenellales bacterium]